MSGLHRGDNRNKLDIILFLLLRNSLSSDKEAVKIRNAYWSDDLKRVVISALVASGFRQLPDNDTFYDVFVPCPLGTFSNSSSEGAGGCLECPPGILPQIIGFCLLCIPNSIKVALGIGNCALGSYCLVVTQAKHCIVFVCSNAQCPSAKATFIELGI